MAPAPEEKLNDLTEIRWPAMAGLHTPNIVPFDTCHYLAEAGPSMPFNTGLSALIGTTVPLSCRLRPPWPETCVWLTSWETLKPEPEAPCHFLGTGITGDTDLPKWPHLL